jgi:hypothetical protein
MSPKIGCQQGNPPESQKGESWLQLTVFGGATPLPKTCKNNIEMAAATMGPHNAELL